MILRLKRWKAWVEHRFEHALRPRGHARVIPIENPDLTGLGWGQAFEQQMDDLERLHPASIEVLRSQWGTGEQRWIAMLWDGDEAEMPSVTGTGETPYIALKEAGVAYRTRLIRQGTTLTWRSI
jgi:hypothetical protein